MRKPTRKQAPKSVEKPVAEALPIPPVSVTVRAPVDDPEDAEHFDDEVTFCGQEVFDVHMRGDRLRLAELLRQLASFVQGVKGAPITGASVVILLHRRQ